MFRAKTDWFINLERKVRGLVKYHTDTHYLFRLSCSAWVPNLRFVFIFPWVYQDWSGCTRVKPYLGYMERAGLVVSMYQLRV